MGTLLGGGEPLVSKRKGKSIFAPSSVYWCGWAKETRLGDVVCIFLGATCAMEVRLDILLKIRQDYLLRALPLLIRTWYHIYANGELRRAWRQIKYWGRGVDLTSDPNSTALWMTRRVQKHNNSALYNLLSLINARKNRKKHLNIFLKMRILRRANKHRKAWNAV